jgi:pyruvate,orthophosphate dikinase
VGKLATVSGVKFKEGDWMTIDGSTGAIFQGQLPLVAAKIGKELETFLSWADTVREGSARGALKGFNVRTNADTPADAKRAFDFGAQGIGLCRTEHMFFDKEKLIHFRAMIVADNEKARKEALKKILPLQKKDFLGIFKAMDGKPVTIRLLDPPLHEFVPHTKAETEELAKFIGVKAKDLQPKIDSLHESNPMLGHRGCRLAITYPEIYDTQVEAIMQAAVELAKKKIPVAPEIMIPLICDPKELDVLQARTRKIVDETLAKAGVKMKVLVGTMIEVPRAAILADKVAKYADFFSYGTNDLTQMTYAFSRDDAGSFLPQYIEQEVLPNNPTETIDEEGVGFLMKHASDYGRKTKADLKLGICGEQGGDPATIDFCYRIGLNYVSCSPFRVPLARLAGAQAVLRNTKK